MNTYDYATQNRREMAHQFLEGAGYDPADWKGQPLDAIAEAVEQVYRDAAARNEIEAYPAWNDGDEIDIRRYVLDLLQQDADREAEFERKLNED